MWRRQQITTDRLLKKHGVPVYRIAAKVHLYRLADIERIEEAAMHRPPLVGITSWKPGTINKTAANTKGGGKEAAP